MKVEIYEPSPSDPDAKLAHLAAEVAAAELKIKAPQVRFLRKFTDKFPMGREVFDLALNTDGLRGICIDGSVAVDPRFGRRMVMTVFHEIRHVWQNSKSEWQNRPIEEIEQDADQFARNLAFRVGIYNGDIDAKLFNYYAKQTEEGR